jgi:Secretion system C-terminal sorting domain
MVGHTTEDDKMKSLSTILTFALLLLIGTTLSQSTAQCQPIITLTPSVLQFPPTPVGAHFDTSYTIKIVNNFDAYWQVDINCPAGVQVSHSGTPYQSVAKWGVGGPTGTYTEIMYVRYTPTDVAGGDKGMIQHDLCYDNPYRNHLSTVYVSMIGSPLPIQLASFKAVALAGKSVTLTWTTVSETNNYGFNVQRDGGNIAFIQGHGTTLDQHTYSYTDNPDPGQHRYGLKQVDLDGTAILSESVVINVTAPAQFALNLNYPNPFNPSTQIAFSITKESSVSLRVYDVLGREVATLVNENRKPGRYTERFDGARLASGIYMYVLRSSEGQLTSRMVLSK